MSVSVSVGVSVRVGSGRARVGFLSRCLIFIADSLVRWDESRGTFLNHCFSPSSSCCCALTRQPVPLLLPPPPPFLIRLPAPHL